MVFRSFCYTSVSLKNTLQFLVRKLNHLHWNLQPYWYLRNENWFSLKGSTIAKLFLHSLRFWSFSQNIAVRRTNRKSEKYPRFSVWICWQAYIGVRENWGQNIFDRNIGFYFDYEANLSLTKKFWIQIHKIFQITQPYFL